MQLQHQWLHQENQQQCQLEGQIDNHRQAEQKRIS